jgi:hypothetical protein
VSVRKTELESGMLASTCGLSALEVFTMPELFMREPVTEPRIEHREGTVARSIEQQTAKLPSDVFLWSAIGSMIASAVLQVQGDKERSLFVGQWAAPFLILGLYNKVVKLIGSERR